MRAAIYNRGRFFGRYLVNVHDAAMSSSLWRAFWSGVVHSIDTRRKPAKRKPTPRLVSKGSGYHMYSVPDGGGWVIRSGKSLGLIASGPAASARLGWQIFYELRDGKRASGE